MRNGLGLGLAAAGMLAFAGTANAGAVDYTGLAFNSRNQAAIFTRIFDDSWSPSSGMDDTNGLGDIGQAVYTLNYAGTDAPSAANLVGGTIDFAAGTKIVFNNGDYMEIQGGQFYIKSSQSSNPTTPLPYGLGNAQADYELARGPDGGVKDSGYLDVLWNGVATVRLLLCESFNTNGTSAVPSATTGHVAPTSPTTR